MKRDNHGGTDEKHSNQGQTEMGMDNVISALLHNDRQTQHLPQVLHLWPERLDHMNVHREIRIPIPQRLDLLLHKGAHVGPDDSGINGGHDQDPHFLPHRHLIKALPPDGTLPPRPGKQDPSRVVWAAGGIDLHQ